MNTTAPIIVASAIDEGYLPFTLVVAHSLAASRRSSRLIEYHILYPGPDSSVLDRVKTFSRPGLRLIVHRRPNRFEHLGTLNGFPSSTFYRAEVPGTLVGYSRAIYVDIDIVVNADIGALFDSDLGGLPIGAAPCVRNVRRGLFNESLTRSGRTWVVGDYMAETLGLKTRAQKLGYRQCAVLLLDLEQLRRIDFASRMLEVAEQQKERLLWLDQCVVNLLFAERMAHIDTRWNVSPFSLDGANAAMVPDELVPQMQLARDNPWLVHFEGTKPWNEPELPGAGLWWRAAVKSGVLPLLVERDPEHWRRRLPIAARLYFTGLRNLHARVRLARLAWLTRGSARSTLRDWRNRAFETVAARLPGPYHALRRVFRAIKPPPPDRR